MKRLPVVSPPAKYPEMESRLCSLILEHRNVHKSRVSSVFIKVKAQQILKGVDPEAAKSFKALIGWQLRFRSHRGLKFRKRQNKKEDEC
jgi:hypothetical protein